MFRGIEPTVNALRERLEANLPGEIDAINAEVTDGYSIEYPQVVEDYVRPLDHLNSFPAIGIACGPGRLKDDTGWAATGVYEIAIVAFLQDADQQGLVRRARRYNLALARAALEPRNLGGEDGAAWGLVLKTWDFGPALAERDGLDDAKPPRSYLTWTAIVLEAKNDEE